MDPFDMDESQEAAKRRNKEAPTRKPKKKNAPNALPSFEQVLRLKGQLETSALPAKARLPPVDRSPKLGSGGALPALHSSDEEEAPGEFLQPEVPMEAEGYAEALVEEESEPEERASEAESDESDESAESESMHSLVKQAMRAQGGARERKQPVEEEPRERRVAGATGAAAPLRARPSPKEPAPASRGRNRPLSADEQQRRVKELTEAMGRATEDARRKSYVAVLSEGTTAIKAAEARATRALAKVSATLPHHSAKRLRAEYETIRSEHRAVAGENEADSRAFRSALDSVTNKIVRLRRKQEAGRIHLERRAMELASELDAQRCELDQIHRRKEEKKRTFRGEANRQLEKLQRAFASLDEAGSVEEEEF